VNYQDQVRGRDGYDYGNGEIDSEEEDDSEFQDALSPPPLDFKTIDIDGAEDDTSSTNYMYNSVPTSAEHLPTNHMNTFLLPRAEVVDSNELSPTYYFSSVASHVLSMTSNLTQSDCATLQGRSAGGTITGYSS